MKSKLIPFGQAASQFEVFVQLPKAAASIRSITARALPTLRDAPEAGYLCGAEQGRGRDLAEATHAAMQVAASNAAAASDFGIGSGASKSWPDAPRPPRWNPFIRQTRKNPGAGPSPATSRTEPRTGGADQPKPRLNPAGQASYRRSAAAGRPLQTRARPQGPGSLSSFSYPAFSTLSTEVTFMPSIEPMTVTFAPAWSLSLAWSATS